jgi:WD40 repeat protein
MVLRRFTLAGLFFWVTFVALALALVVPLYRTVQRSLTWQDTVVALAASADGSKFGALMGDGSVLIWDSSGTLVKRLRTQGGLTGQLALSSDGRLAAVSHGLDRRTMQASGGVEVWKVDAGKLLRTLPAPSTIAHTRLAFSPTQSLLAVQHIGGDTEIYSVDTKAPPHTIQSKGVGASFSPDGRMLAISTSSGGIWLYDAVTYDVLQRLAASEDDSGFYQLVAWSPDGKSVVSLPMVGSAGFPSRIRVSPTKVERWRVDTSDHRVAELPRQTFFGPVTFLPTGQALAIANHGSGVAFADATTLQPLPTETTGDASHLAAGSRGNRFIVAGMHDVSLWDATTLRPLAPLRSQVSQPKPRLAIFGLVAWIIAYIVWRARRLRHACQTCGLRFQTAGREDTDVNCPACRLLANARELSPADFSSYQRRAFLRRMASPVLWGFAATLCPLALLLPLLIDSEWLLLVTAFLLIALLVKAIVRLVEVLVQNTRRYRNALARPAKDVRLAEEVAGAAGTTRQLGQLLVWSAPGTSLAEVLEEEIEVADDRLQKALGRRPPPPNARVFFFQDGETLARYTINLGTRFVPRLLHQSVYLVEPRKRLLIGEREARQRHADPRVVVRSVLTYHLLHIAAGRPPAPWIFEGIASALAHDGDPGALARLNRRVLAGREAGRTIGAAELFGSGFLRNWWKHQRRADLKHFAWSNLFSAQSWSMIEFVCGAGSTPERQLAFQRFFDDPDRRRQPRAAMTRHFGYGFDEFFAQWQAWVDDQGIGEHLPPAANVAGYLLAGPIAKVASPATPLGERIMAIRELGELGFLTGADALIALLGEDNQDCRREAVWALQCISGKALGSSAANWRAWWHSVNRGGWPSQAVP